MPRASSILCFPAMLALATSAHAIELPVIVNGEQFVQAPKTPPATPPAAAKVKLPLIYNYPSAAMAPAPGDAQKADSKAPNIINQSAATNAPRANPARFAVAYNVPIFTDYMTPVAYNAYRSGPTLGAYTGGMGYGMDSPYSAGLGAYGGLGYGGYGYSGYSAPLPVAPWGVGWLPPRVEVLDTGIRANVGHLASMPAVAAPVYGDVIGIYYR